MNTCRADMDGECGYDFCPQLRDDEPAKSGRHCPLDTNEDGEYLDPKAAAEELIKEPRHSQKRPRSPLAYTSEAKDWWQKHSDELGAVMDWDSFCTVWMAALNNENQNIFQHGPSAAQIADRISDEVISVIANHYNRELCDKLRHFCRQLRAL